MQDNSSVGSALGCFPAHDYLENPLKLESSTGRMFSMGIYLTIPTPMMRTL